MAKLWDLCDVHVINLYSRNDRYEHIIRELQRVGIESYEMHRFHKHPVSAALGLFENVISIISKAIRSQKPILIIEDDAVFIETSIPLLDCIYDFIKNTTLSWDTIRLGYNKVVVSHKVDDNLCIGNAVMSTANIYSLDFAIKLVNRYKGQVPHTHIDRELARISGRNIIPIKNIVIQGHLGSDNKWPSTIAWKEFLQDPTSYQQKYNNIGWKCFHSYTYMPMCIKYYWLMSLYHTWYNVVGLHPNIFYETKFVCNI